MYCGREIRYRYPYGWYHWSGKSFWIESYCDGGKSNTLAEPEIPNGIVLGGDHD
ncbi:hypothetical protein SEA_TENNO_85 [Arthrobacter phage Tenno]|uniref:Uncharacterized protein n=1 Tax=Arthrobacter phage Tenno TaxID=2315702 RepID=A0A386KNV4_9CAUD|nr:hypothetical protein SEA_TENNO_85 [Arthrobacter phage Tenno]